MLMQSVQTKAEIPRPAQPSRPPEPSRLELSLARESAAEMATLRLPELLAPAGDWDCAKAAVENGADAIYFGLDRFNVCMKLCVFMWVLNLFRLK